MENKCMTENLHKEVYQIVIMLHIVCHSTPHLGLY